MGSADEPRCHRLTDFDTVEGSRRYEIVNDEVMGGRSVGRLSLGRGILVFQGELRTDGGGFSSFRLPLEGEVLSRHDRVEFRGRSDGRKYLLTFDDGPASGDRRVSHRAPIEFGAPGTWQTVSVLFSDLVPVVFGRPIDDLAFRPDLATRMGVMIRDGVDGAFRLELDWIDLCPR